jgi:hypothetical protein
MDTIPEQMERYAGGGAGGEHGEEAEAELEDGDKCREGERRGCRVEGAQDGDVEVHGVAGEHAHLFEQHMQPEPQSQI